MTIYILVAIKFFFENGIAVGVEKNIIHSFNKNKVSIPPNITEKLENREQVILLSDQVSDLNMVDKNAHDFVLTVGFVTDEQINQIDVLEDNFDIVCEKDDDYFSLNTILF